MKIRITKRRKSADIEGLMAAWEKKYGSQVSLHQKLLISKCTSPELMTDYVLWNSLSQGAEFQDIIVVKDPDIFEVLTPKRMEILEHLMGNEPASIRSLAGAIHRNYKNTYDDLTALARYGLIDIVPRGRSSRPSAAASKIEITFDP
ncbi:MAG TPA: hypothetical protein DCR97_13325 [Deltaproteobacteria bacterium]|jgi:hypothetical protein|nr:hypothetical protein [Deltaproteobacteria bacterium]